MSQSHSFNVEVAKQLDVHRALFVQHFSFWYQKNKTDNVNFFKGDYWVRMKISQLHTYFPYYTVDQIRRFIEKLLADKLLKKDEFNDKKNDRTKWYTFTKKGKKLVGISTEKKAIKPIKKQTGEIANNMTGEIASPTGEIANSIYKEVDIEYRYILLLKEINQNLNLLEVIAMQNKLSVNLVKEIAETYVKNKVASKTIFNNRTHFLNSFSKWVLDNNYKNLDEQLNWFLEKFNLVSKRQFVKTDTIQQRFARQFSFGFTGAQMVKAVQNMYSSNVKNDYHLKTAFKFATPEYLLKDDNLNKYLNLRY